MLHIHNISTQSSILAIAAYKVVLFFDNRLAAIAKWKEQRETFKSLHKLTDRELNDIGISRGDIRSIANDTWHENSLRDTYPHKNPNLRGFV
jgi:uncharacterized protein YjiS (DUF1127 family)|tara:strand:+ start:183 stop:458 length:276 start_codon:yes stop_codon:yes gene_type:complete